MIKAVQCPQCGAGVSTPSNDPGKERLCEYCGSVIKTFSYPPNASDESAQPIRQHSYICPKHCPRCHHRTVEKEVNDCRIRACYHCGGVWIPHKALKRFDKLTKRQRVKLKQLNQSKIRRKSSSARSLHGTLRCPRCAKTMTQSIYSRGTTIMVDVCKRHGAWFDEDELLVAHRDISRRLGLRYDSRRKWDRRRKMKSSWEYGSMFILFKILADIVDDLFD